MVQLDTDIIQSTSTDANAIVSMFQNASPGFFIFVFLFAIAIIILGFFTIVTVALKKHGTR